MNLSIVITDQSSKKIFGWVKKGQVVSRLNVKYLFSHYAKGRLFPSCCSGYKRSFSAIRQTTWFQFYPRSWSGHLLRYFGKKLRSRIRVMSIPEEFWFEVNFSKIGSRLKSCFVNGGPCWYHLNSFVDPTMRKYPHMWLEISGYGNGEVVGELWGRWRSEDLW